MDELKNAIELYNIDVICITETHFNSEHLDAEISIKGYHHYRRDRDFKIDLPFFDDECSKGGGPLYM